MLGAHVPVMVIKVPPSIGPEVGVILVAVQDSSSEKKEKKIDDGLLIRSIKF